MTTEAIVPSYLAKSEPRIYSTNPDNFPRARTFVWSNARWYEREVSVIGTGAVAFAAVADSDEELRTWLRESDLDVDELDTGDFADMVREEFVNQLSLLLDVPEMTISR